MGRLAASRAGSAAVAAAALLAAAATLAEASMLRRPAAAGLRLGETALLLAHDAGTAYMATAAAGEEELDWTKTQPDGGFAALLDCGVRAFDVRPKLDSSGRVIMHHGIVSLPTGLDAALRDVDFWSQSHPGELILLYFSHFAAPDGKEGLLHQRTREILRESNTTVYESCTDLATLTVEQAISVGPVIAVIQCVNEHYDSSIVCDSIGYRCDKPGENGVPLRRLQDYMERVSREPAQPNQLDMLQGHWQSTPESIFLGTLRGGSILADNRGSRINHIIANNVRNGAYKHINLLEVDNACDGGHELFQALQDYNAGQLLAPL